MSDFLKGNFEVKRPVVEKAAAADTEQAAFKKEFRRKALQSVGGSMVFVEMDALYWDGESAEGGPKKG